MNAIQCSISSKIIKGAQNPCVLEHDQRHVSSDQNPGYLPYIGYNASKYIGIRISQCKDPVMNQPEFCLSSQSFLSLAHVMFPFQGFKRPRCLGLESRKRVVVPWLHFGGGSWSTWDLISTVFLHLPRNNKRRCLPSIRFEGRAVCFPGE